jgi:hypothetical protein
MLERFDGTCERNLTEMLSMEWERDIEAGTSILHQRAFTGTFRGSRESV